MKDPRIYLISILDCIVRLQEYTRDGRDIFLSSTLIQDGVIRNLEVIGEATKQLSDEIKEAYPDVAWKGMAGLRDVLIHDYLRVSLSRVWVVIEVNIPSLKVQIEKILEHLDNKDLDE